MAASAPAPVDRERLLERALELQSAATPLTAVLASAQHVQQLADEARNSVEILAVDRLARHLDLVIDALEQTASITEAGFGSGWRAALASFEPLKVNSAAAATIHVLSPTDTIVTKAFMLVVLNRVRDHLELDELHVIAGHRPAANSIAVLDRVFADPNIIGAGLTTQLIRRLAKPRPRIRNALIPDVATPSAETWAVTTAGLMLLSTHLLLSNIPRVTVTPLSLSGSSQLSGPVELWTHDEMVLAIDSGELSVWQRMASAIQQKPWSDFARRIGAAGEASIDSHAAAALLGVKQFSRALRDEREREEIAKRITRLVTATGLTQKGFASRIGTSGSRLSTYMSGSVTPSASMLLRIEEQKAQIDHDRAEGYF